MRREQTWIVLSVALAFGLTILAYWSVEIGFVSPPTSWTLDRFALGAACAAASATALFGSVMAIALFRFLSDEDRVGAGLAPPPGTTLRIQHAIAQNTLEQTVLAALGHFAFAATASASALPFAPIAVAFFLIGRMLFAVGYRHGVAGRAFGFALTFVPTAALYLLAALSLMVAHRAAAH